MRLMIAELELASMPATNKAVNGWVCKTAPPTRIRVTITSVLQSTAAKSAIPNWFSLRKLKPMPVENIRKIKPSCERV